MATTPTESRPHILLITTDQQRGDCLGLEGHPVLQTPHLDHLGRSGTHFRRAYAECPSCIAARRTILTGMAPVAHGMVGYHDGMEWNPPHTLPGELSKAGYQTHLVGKLHMFPHRKRYGFDSMDWADSTNAWTQDGNDYVDWLVTQGLSGLESGMLRPGSHHGVTENGWIGRPSHLEETQTHTYWCVTRALDFLRRRDPSTPFFMHLSFIDPHPPLTPPRFHYDRYAAMKLPEPVVGDWARKFDGPQRGLHPDAHEVSLDAMTMHFCRAAYYGMINHIDDQVGRLINYMGRTGLMQRTFVIFTSDHGEMLGDHNLFRKTYAYEASARVPFLVRAPASMKCPGKLQADQPVGLQDIAPTLLDVAGVARPAAITGKSLLPLIRGEKVTLREALHGEHSTCYGPDNGNHFMTDGREKYIWHSQNGREQLFDLTNDPNEMNDLALRPAEAARVARWRERMVKQLAGRPEGFSDGQRLVAGRPHQAMVPGA